MLLLLGPAPAHLHDALVHAPEHEVEEVLPVGGYCVGEEVAAEGLHLQHQHLPRAQVGVARADHIPLHSILIRAGKLPSRSKKSHNLGGGLSRLKALTTLSHL